MRVWELLRIVLQGIMRRPLRTFLTTLGVAVAAGALISMVGYALGFQSQMEESVSVLGMLTRIEVSAPAGSGEGSKGGEDQVSDAVLDEDSLRRIAAIEGVTSAYPDTQISNLRISWKESSTTANALGIPPEAAQLRLFEGLLVAGRLVEPNTRAVLLATTVVRELGFDDPASTVGETVVLSSDGLELESDARFEFRRQELEVEVAGVFELPSMGFAAAGGSMVLAPQHLLQQFPGSHLDFALARLRRGDSAARSGVMRAHVLVDSIDDLDGIERQIREMGFITRNYIDDVEQARTMFLIIDSLLLSVGFVALVVAGLGIVNTLLMTVLERVREIGVFKALGASSGEIRLMFLAEAGVVGVVGGIGGLVLGLSVSWVLRVVLANVAQQQGLNAEIARFEFPAWLLLGSIAFSIAVSILSALYPASRAAATDPIKALRSQ